MPLQSDEIVPVPPNRVKYFGTTGKMLLPSPATIEAVINTIPEKQLITTTLLRQKLTKQFNVQGTCPVTTKKALQAIANDSSKKVAYWRVINKNGGIISTFPGGIKNQTALLRQEGFTVDTTGKTAKVKNFKESLVQLD